MQMHRITCLFRARCCNVRDRAFVGGKKVTAVFVEPDASTRAQLFGDKLGYSLPIAFCGTAVVESAGSILGTFAVWCHFH